MELTGKLAELVVTAGVDQHTDDFLGPLHLVVRHNGGLKFKQRKVSHMPEAGDYFIFEDLKDCGVSLVREWE